MRFVCAKCGYKLFTHDSKTIKDVAKLDDSYGLIVKSRKVYHVECYDINAQSAKEESVMNKKIETVIKTKEDDVLRFSDLSAGDCFVWAVSTLPGTIHLKDEYGGYTRLDNGMGWGNDNIRSSSSGIDDNERVTRMIPENPFSFKPETKGA